MDATEQAGDIGALAGSAKYEVPARSALLFRAIRNAALPALFLAPGMAGAAQAETAVPPPDCTQYSHLAAPFALGVSTTACSTVDPEMGGLRKELAKHGVGIFLMANMNFSYDLRSDDQSPQIYGGQKPTYLGNASLMVTYDLSKLGLPDGSLLALNPLYTYSSYEPNGLTTVYMRHAYAYVPLMDRQVTLYAGFMDVGNMFNTMGIGDIAGATVLGAGSSLVGQLGLSGFVPTPSFIANFTTADQRFYTQIGISRSVSPRGMLDELKHDPTGLRWDADGANLAVINEIGYRLPPAPGQKKIWLRLGAIYNNSDYARFDNPADTEDNYGFYAIADLQLTQPDASLAYRGWYVRGNASFSNPHVNGFSRDYGITLYSAGTFASRPEDMFSIAASQMEVSGDLRDSLGRQGISSAGKFTTASMSYAYKVRPGVYWTNALAYTSTPSIAPERKSTFNVISNLMLSF